MKLILKRNRSKGGATIGKLFNIVDKKEVFVCYTLEDVIRPKGIKLAGKTCIPPGTYPITLTMSNRFKKAMPLLGNVKNFEGVRIHSGNTAEDTEGCILVGLAVDAAGESIIKSRLAFDSVFGMIRLAIARDEKVTLEITQPEEEIT